MSRFRLWLTTSNNERIWQERFPDCQRCPHYLYRTGSAFDRWPGWLKVILIGLAAIYFGAGLLAPLFW